MKTLKFAIEKTVQIHEYEPVKIYLSIEDEVENEERMNKKWFKKTYEEASSLCDVMVKKEIKKSKK